MTRELKEEVKHIVNSFNEMLNPEIAYFEISYTRFGSYHFLLRGPHRLHLSTIVCQPIWSGREDFLPHVKSKLAQMIRDAI